MPEPTTKDRLAALEERAERLGWQVEALEAWCAGFAGFIQREWRVKR